MAKWVALKARVDCPECGLPVFLDGPWANARCPSCHAVSPVGEMWNFLAQRADEEGPRGKQFELMSVRNLNWPVPTVDYAVNKDQPPICDCGGGGNLKIDSEHRRIVTCEFCESDVFLPAELWHRLHPVRRRRAFWLRCR